jgi:hypothetical protein
MTDPIAQARAGVNRDVIDGPQTDHEKLIYEYEKRIFDLEVAANKARAEGRAEGIREAAQVLRAALEPFATAFEIALSGGGTRSLGLIEANAYYHLKGGAFKKAHEALRALSEETRT